MRLIEADRLKEIIEHKFAYSEDFKQIVDAQPTAYDVDKVVEQLERMKNWATCHPKYVKNPCAGDVTCARCKMTYAIEIVEAGGTDT